MSRYVLAPLARNDLIEIWDYIAQDNPDAADRTIDGLRERFIRIAAEPNMGRRRPEFLGGRCRSLPVGNYIIFYVPGENDIEIARILHGARNLPDLLG